MTGRVCIMRWEILLFLSIKMVQLDVSDDFIFNVTFYHTENLFESTNSQICMASYAHLRLSISKWIKETS
jgi:hypothetical protein